MTHPIFSPHWSRFLGPNPPDPHQHKYQTHEKPIFTSPFGPFPLSPEDLNIHELCFPPNNPLLEDYPFMLNAVSKETVTLDRFYNRTCALARVFRHDGPNLLKLGKSLINDREDGEILGLLYASWRVEWPCNAKLVYQMHDSKNNSIPCIKGSEIEQAI